MRDINFNDFTDVHDPYKMGEVVKFKGFNVKILERQGKNSSGVYEYYVAYTDHPIQRIYVMETEICKMSYSSSDTPPPTPEEKKQCKHDRSYLNVISTNLKFYVCPDCKLEVEPFGLSFRPVKAKSLDEENNSNIFEEWNSIYEGYKL